MILIFSKAKLELSTEKVIDWLTYYGAAFTRINGQSFLNDDMFSLNDSSFRDKFENVNVCWFRRFFEPDANIGLLRDIESSNDNIIALSKYLTDERASFARLLWLSLSDKIWLTNPLRLNTSKIEVLMAAQQVGLKVPDTIITSKKLAVSRFREKHGRIITKPIVDCITLETATDIITSKTAEVTEEILNRMPGEFYPSKFQQLIEKEFEIRSFFLGGKFYSMAIFSQNRRSTEIDFRNYDLKNPVRTVPICLSAETEGKLLMLMDNLKFNTGSIDLIRSKAGEDIFLEVNLGGQFGMTSAPCNYYLHREISKFLINNA